MSSKLASADLVRAKSVDIFVLSLRTVGVDKLVVDLIFLSSLIIVVDVNDLKFDVDVVTGDQRS